MGFAPSALAASALSDQPKYGICFCGDGSFMRRLKTHFRESAFVRGVDPGFEVLLKGRRSNPDMMFYQASIYDLPFPGESFDMVLVPEVLEHLENPEIGLEECERIGRKWFIFSVPREPLWRIGNMLSGRYWSHWGNTPGHLQHWSKKAFISFVRSRLYVVDTASPFPWTIVLARKK
jgi:hypothetical protein